MRLACGFSVSFWVLNFGNYTGVIRVYLYVHNDEQDNAACAVLLARIGSMMNAVFCGFMSRRRSDELFLVPIADHIHPRLARKFSQKFAGAFLTLFDD